MSRSVPPYNNNNNIFPIQKNSSSTVTTQVTCTWALSDKTIKHKTFCEKHINYKQKHERNQHSDTLYRVHRVDLEGFSRNCLESLASSIGIISSSTAIVNVGQLLTEFRWYLVTTAGLARQRYEFQAAKTLFFIFQGVTNFFTNFPIRTT